MLSLEKSTTIAAAAIEAGVKPTSLGDLMLQAEAADIKPGQLQDWLQEQRTNQSTWFSESAKPETPPSPTTPPTKTEEPNPWTHDNWNMTKQGQFLLKNGQEKADQMAKLAGTTVGGLRPKQAPATPTTPATPTAPAAPAASPALNTPKRDSAGRFLPKENEEPNPFAPETWNLTKQMQLYKADPAKAEKLAAAAGVKIGDTRPRPAPDRAIAIIYKTRRR